jgi:hypothetical protein
MKIKFLATGQAPEKYSFNGEVLTAFKDGESEDFDFSVLEEGGRVDNIEVEALDLSSSAIIRKAERMDSELKLVLCQKTPVTDVVIRFEEYGGAKISYAEFKKYDIKEGESVPNELKDESQLWYRLTKKHTTDDEFDKESAKKEYEQTDVIAEEIQYFRSGHWRKSDWIDASEYDSNEIYIKRID